jgi:hypothetical protein
VGRRKEADEPVSDLQKLRLCGGPLDGREIEDYDLLSGIELVFPRIAEEGLMVQDYYLVADDGGTLVGNFEHTETVPAAVAWPDEPDDTDPLDPDLPPYLDWPADWDENEVWCAKEGCTTGDCGNDDPGSRAWLCSRYHLTGRQLLAGIRNHAEGKQADGG